jgi:hypothetical protein
VTALALSVTAVPTMDPIVRLTQDAIDQKYPNWRAFSVPGGAPAKDGQRSPMLLTGTSKMPCPSWSLTAGKACPGAKFGEGTICGSCYAAKGMYLHKAVQNAQRERFAWTLALMKSEPGRDAFVAYLTKAIAATKNPYFRVHDSGDLFSQAYTRCWIRIARNLPGIRFWFPTRSYRIANILPVIQELAALPNVTVRPSALMLDAAPPVIDGLAAGSGATYAESEATCPAYRQDGECRDCRHCWDNAAAPVLYPLH